jgi:uncharacterized protein
MLGMLILALILIAIGLVGTVVPGLPGLPLVMGGIVLFSVGSRFEVIGPFQLAIAVGLGLLGIGLSVLGNLLGARKMGASRGGLLGGVIGLVLGLLMLGPFGLIVGTLVGAIVGELISGRDLAQALRSGAGVVIGYLLGTVTEMALALGLAAWFVWSTIGLFRG